MLKYVLKTASRVHMQAGTADRTSKDPAAGAVLRTIVNREPRPAGSIVEQWNGFDESGTIFVTDLPNFVVAIAATPLPEGSVITTGNRSRTFVSSIAERKGVSLLANHSPHQHHGGLGAIDDASPSLMVKPMNAAAIAGKKASYQLKDHSLQLHVEPVGETADSFVKQAANLQVYIDGRLAAEKRVRGRAMRLDIPLRGLKEGSHVVAVNWGSAHGPLAASAFTLTR
jgi:hypothetical protein